MFTGIIESVGRVESMIGGRLTLDIDTSAWPDPILDGESISVNGCCLTVLPPRGNAKSAFDLSPETLSRTTLESLKPGDRVNLERAMRADGRFGGHIVQGHVDATGQVVSITPLGNSTIFHFRVPDGTERYLLDKGSITVDGISLTVVEPVGAEFHASIIPHTLANTNLGSRTPGDRVNLEFDALARYVERLMKFR